MKKVLVTGGTGMIGRSLKTVIPDAIYISSKDCDLCNQVSVNNLFTFINPDYVIHLAAKVGGVKANSDFLGDFYKENILINTNVLEAAKKFKTKKVLSLLSTCIYPANPTYPLTEEQIHNGPPHFSNYGKRS